MAEIERENVDILSIDTEQAVLSLRDLRKQIEADAIALAGLTEGTDAYRAAADKLAGEQELLNKAIGLAKSVNEPAAGSYAAIQKEMTALRKEWRATADEAKRKELGTEINRLNNQLKQMDAEIGVYNRNVGNYGNALGQAFTQAGKVIGGNFTQAVNTANGAMKMFATNPVGAMLSLLVPLIMRVVDGLKSSEDNANAAAQAFSGFKVVGDLVTKALQGLGRGIGWVGEQFTKLLDKLNIGVEKRRERQAITEAEIELQQRERANMVENARAEEQVSELRAKAVDKETYTAAERRAFLEEAIGLEKEMNERRLAEAQSRLEILQRQAQLTENDRETNDRLAEAEANLYRVRKDYNDRMRSLQRELQRNGTATATEAAKSQAQIEAEAFAERLAGLETFNAKWEQKERERHARTAAAEAEALARMQVTVPAGLQQLAAEANEAYQTDLFNKEMAERAKQRLEEATFSTAKSSLDGLADLLEASGEENEKAVTAAKGLRVASAVMDTYAAANSAYNAMAGIPVVGPGLGIAAAAAAIASGIANVRQILAVSTTGGGQTATPSASTAQTAVVQAPAVIREVAAQRTLTTGTQERQLNRMAEDVRVYVVESDIAQAGHRVAVRESEGTFR